MRSAILQEKVHGSEQDLRVLDLPMMDTALYIRVGWKNRMYKSKIVFQFVCMSLSMKCLLFHVIGERDNSGEK